MLYSPPGTPLRRREFPAALADDERYAAVGVTTEAQLTLPTDPPVWLTGEERQAYEAELSRIADEPIHRLLGHPDPVQADPRKGLTLLLQVDSDDAARMAWGDLGRLYFLIDPRDLRTRRFDAARCAWQSH